MKKVLVINGHPDKQSFNYALAAAYRKGLDSTAAEVDQINIAELHFNPNLMYGYDFLWMKSPVINQFKKGTLEFCGVSPVKVTYIAPIKGSTPVFREKWLEKAYKLGVQLQ